MMISQLIETPSLSSLNKLSNVFEKPNKTYESIIISLYHLDLSLQIYLTLFWTFM